MATDDNHPDDTRQKLLDLFTRQIDVSKPDFEHALTTTAADLQAGKTRAYDLFSAVPRADLDQVDPQAVGRLRFPDLQGVCALFGQGLAKNPDIVAEILVTPDDISQGIALDQSIGRFIYAGQILSLGGDTGQVLAGMSAQKLCTDTVDDARTRSLDQAVPLAMRSSITIIFEEPQRMLQDQRQRQRQAQAAGERGVQPARERTDQAQQDTDLAAVVDSYMTSVKKPGGTTA